MHRFAGLRNRTETIRLAQLKLGSDDKYLKILQRFYAGEKLDDDIIPIRWFCEMSGVLFFTLGEGTECPGAFALNLATHEVQTMAGGLDCHRSWENFVGYECQMDGATCLASVAPLQHELQSSI